MKRFFPLLCLLLAGCGSGANLDAVTPVLAEVPGTYQLAYTEVTVTSPTKEVFSFRSYSTGTLKLLDNSTYSRTTRGGLQQSTSQGNYLFAGSTSSILGSRKGSFTLTPSGTNVLTTDSGTTVITGFGPPIIGDYEVTPDFTLKLRYPSVSLPDSSSVVRANVWVKQSDIARQ
jgi:hypothetical protein